ncbi:nitrate high affinity transporter [Tribonema minus]|uniref:Nitrate high affinity transporter n=1 Tax=Tribonema minus TaxID=303371 RepID=A0A835Z8M0_9STRA|nr:nitrate high affinity transporter [Tribonema minus]
MSQQLPSTVWQKYDTYDLDVDPKQEDRAVQFKLSTFSRPHMRSFYISTFSFFMAFACWFSFAPLVAEGTVKKDLQLTADDISNANIAALSSTVIARLILGPLCDAFGARIVMAGLLFFGAIPTFFQGLVQDAQGLAICRFFVGFLGATFVANQAWSSTMFGKNVVGRANATSAGWGNLGGGVTHIIMVGLYEGYKKIMSTEEAWRVSFIVPAAIVMLCSFATFLFADDCPKGNYNELIKNHAMVRKSSKKSAESAVKSPNSWILALHYGCSFGVELIVFNVSTSYFVNTFGMKLPKAALVSAAFGFFNIFSRPGGGWLSDTMNQKFGAGSTGMRGRLIVHFILMLCSGCMLLAFSFQNDSLGGSIACLIAFAIAMQAVNGSTYSIVPYVAPEATGAVSGMAGAGGNVGAVCWSLIFRFGPAPNLCFRILSYIILGAACTAPLISIRGYDTLFTKAKDEMAAIDVDGMDGKRAAPQAERI